MKNNNLLNHGVILGCILGTALFAANLGAKDIFVSQAGGGTRNSIAWLSSASSWNGSLIAPGDIIHLEGIFTSSLVIGGGGTPGNPVTILFEPGAKFSKPTWGTVSAYASGVATPQDSAIYSPLYVHDLVIDGGIDGVIECTSNGNGGAFTNHCTGINFFSKGNVEIKNLTIRNLCVYYGSDAWRPIYPYFTNLNGTTNWTSQNVYDRWPTPGARVANEKPVSFLYMPASTDGIRISPNASTNLLIHNNKIDMVGNAISLSMSSGFTGAWAVNTNIQIYSNTFTHFNWGVGWLQSTPFTLCYNSGVWANSFDYSENWNGNPNGDTSLNNNHGDSLFLSCSGDYSGPATNYNMQVYRNYFGNNMTTNLSAWLYQETTISAKFWQGLRIYNNVFRRDIPNFTGTSALIDINGDNTLVANNTFIGTNVSTRSVGPPDHGIISVSSGVGVAISATGARAPSFYNNLVYNLAVAVASWVHLTDAMTNVDCNAYTFINNPDSRGFPLDNNQYMKWGYQVANGGITDWNGWRAIGNDRNGTTARPFLAPNFAPLPADRVLIGKGTNLTALGITDDFYGNPRPSSLPWTIGAFEVTRSTNSIVPPRFNSVTKP